MTKRPALGKGLGALIPAPEGQRQGSAVLHCRTDEILPNPDQPRSAFDQDGLEALAETIRERGILQPLLVRRKEEGFELIAGERRLRAAKIAGIETVPIVVLEIDADDRLEISLLENIQRENLNPIEEAQAYKTMLERFGLTQEELAKKLGKDRSSLANTLRLLHLPKEIQHDIANGALSPGHGRALLTLPEAGQQTKARNVIRHKKLSVRETETYLKKLQQDIRGKHKNTQAIRDPDITHIQEELRKYYGTKVNIVRHGKGGSVQINFYSWDDLDRIYTLLTR